MIQAHRLDDLTRRHLRRLELLAHDVTAPFSCGGTVPLAALPTLRFPTGHRLPLDLDRGSYRVVEALKRRARKASFGEGSSTRHDPRVRDGLQLSASGGAFTVEGFDPEALGILATARAALCPRDPSPLRAELYALNVYDSGGHFAPHKDTPRGDDMLGSLVIGLASLYEGGDLVIVHRGATETYAWGGRRLGTEPHAGWAAFFGDVDHEVRSVSSGTRITLSYILRRGEGAALDVAAPHAQTEALADALSEALADRAFLPHGGVLGFSCFHLYAESPGLLRGATAITEAALPAEGAACGSLAPVQARDRAAMTYPEYLDFERAAEGRHEFVNGLVYAMAGGSPEHARLAQSIGAELRAALRAAGCAVFSSDLRVRVLATGRSTYPDLTVVCGRLERAPDDDDAVTNPTVLVEVLSDATETADRGDTWAHYQRIPSLQAYLLVSQSSPRIEVFARDEAVPGGWQYRAYGAGETVKLARPLLRVDLDAVYDNPLG